MTIFQKLSKKGKGKGEAEGNDNGGCSS